MSVNIIQVYVRLIKEGRRTLESVPEQIRAEVAKELKAEGAEQA